MKNTSITKLHFTASVQNIFTKFIKIQISARGTGDTSVYKLLVFLFAFCLFGEIVNAQTTITYVMQDANFLTQFNDGGDFFNNGSTELGMWANSGNKKTAAWRTFKIAGDNTGSDRSLQIGDVFKITVAATRAFGQIGFSLNAGGTQGSNYDNRISGSRLYFNTDNYAAWYVNRSGGNTSLSYVPIQNTLKDYIFTIRITSSTTADVYLTVDGADYRAYNLTMNGSGNIDSFSIYGADIWDGDSNDNAYWKQPSTVTNSKRVELGYYLTSGIYTPGVISDGLDAGSTSTSSANDIYISGNSGTSIKFTQANTYSGKTTVNVNATLELGASGVIPDNSAMTLDGGTLKTGATIGYTETAGTLTLSANSTISFGTGSHTLTFAASNGVTWAGTTLTVNNWTSTGPKLYFGSSSSGLTTDQLAKINFTGFGLKARILSTGEVIPASYISTLAGNWNSVNSWVGGIIPSSGADVFIQNGHNITLDANVTVASLTINSGGIFTASDGSARILTITKSTSGQVITLANSGSWANNGSNTSTVVFTGSPIGGNAIHEISGSIAFQNITVNKTGGSSDVGCTFGATSSVSGTLEIGAGGYIASAPPTSFYGANAILKFNQGSGVTYDVNNGDFSWSTTVIPNYITISSGTVNINASRTATGNLLIDGGTLALNAGLTIQGNWTRTSGTFTPNSQTVTLSGSALNTVISTASDASLYDLVVSKTGGKSVSLSSNLTVSHNMTISSGAIFTIPGTKTLTVSGTLTNDAGNTGLLLESGASLIHNTANVKATIKRNIAAASWTTGNSGWHFISSPVRTEAISGNWTPTGANNDYDFFAWSESATSLNWLNQKVGANNITSFVLGKGYLVAYQTEGEKIFQDSVNIGPVSFSNLTNTSGNPHAGWHLLGNPFASSVKWTQGTWSKSNIGAYLQIWNSSGTSYKVLAGPSQGIIPPMNGFMVYTSGNGSLTIPADARVHSDSTWYKNSPEGNFISLSAQDLDLGGFQETLLQFIQDGKIEFDDQEDCLFMSGYAPLFYSTSDTRNLALNTLPLPDSDTKIPLTFIPNASHNFSINLDVAMDGTTLFLTDLKMNKTTNLTQDLKYTFSSSSSDDKNRFVLHFGNVGIENKQLEEPFMIYSQNNVITLSMKQPKSISGEIYVTNMLGKIVLTETFFSNCNHQIPLSAPTGYYLVRVVTPEATQTAKIFIK